MPLRTIFFCVSLTLFFVFNVQVANGFQDWTSFQNGGVPISSDSVPTEWSPESGIKWKTDLAGYGQSTPVVFGDQVYVTSVSGANKEQLHVQALDAKSGKEIWQFQIKNSTPEKNNSYVSRAAPSPVCDQAGVICFFEGGNVFALSHDGKERWAIDLTKTEGSVKTRHGIAASLEQDQDHVFIWVERETDPYVLAVSKSDGTVVWRSSGLGTTSWSSPRLIDVEGARHLVLSGSGKIAGLDAKTGERAWEFTEIGGNTTPTPIPIKEGQFLIGASVGRGASSDGKTAKSNGVIQIKRNADGFTASWLWQATRATSSFGSPVYFNEQVYFVNRQGVVFCLDAKNGEEVYAKRMPSGSVWATPLVLNGKLYFFGKDGVTTILEDAKEMEEIATNELWAPAAQRGGAMGGPVLYAATPHSQGLLLRRGDTLFCVEGEQSASGQN